ncbi:microtubule-associated protein tau isoform X2 [Condylostylus longicornis]|uniref:microtubule-associated protein tau isoform X2 n=1 Tax=Condylostylus longicornis TaxID=2530218 RepID=UPI00244E28FD|nr:microtubule-associated protein tau isoform X2 [Condylostylus longicornis]
MTDAETIRNQTPPRPQFVAQPIRPNPPPSNLQSTPAINQIRPQLPNPQISTNGQSPRPAPPQQLRRADSKGNIIMSVPSQPPQPRPQAQSINMNANRPPASINQMLSSGVPPRPQIPLNPQQQNQMRPTMQLGGQQQNPQTRPPYPSGSGGPRLPGQHPVTAPNQPPYRPPTTFQQQQQQQQQQPYQQQQHQQQPKVMPTLTRGDSNASMNFDPVKNQMNVTNSKITYQINEGEDNSVTMTKVITPVNNMVTLKQYAPSSPEDTPREKKDSEKIVTPVEEPPKVIQQKTYTELKKKKGDNDSGVDESTQEKDRNGPGSPNSPVKSPTKPQSGLSRPPSATPSNKSRSASRSRLLAKTPEPEPVKKVPMNKIKVGYAPSPDLKSVRSKIGSLDNSSYRPGGGQVKIETKKVEIKAAPRIEAKNEKYTPKGGDKKIVTTKLNWNAKSKIGSLENASHKPGGGDKKIETLKTDFKEKAKPKVGSKDNVKHIPGGGDIKIQTQKIEVKAQSKIGSMDNVKHKPGGGDKKIFDDKEYLKNIEHHVALTQPSQSPVPSVNEMTESSGTDENLNKQQQS